MSRAYECECCANLFRAVVVHPALKARNGKELTQPVLWCRGCMRNAVKERVRAARGAVGKMRDDILSTAEQLRRAAEGPAFVPLDERQLTFGGE